MHAESLSPDDESFLDEVFDLSVRACSTGAALDLDALLAGREHLRGPALRLLQDARDVALFEPHPPPVRDLGVVAGFTVLEEAGRGGMGTVYRARQESLGRVVALKVLAPSLLVSQRSRERFANEAKALGRVHHPHVVSVHEVIAQDVLCAYAMEWVEGTTLAKAIAARDPSLDVAAVARLGVTIASALTAVHAAGLVHRDVKPSNILLRRDGTPVLSDFGLVHDAEHGMHTETGEFLGTAAYAAPEQLLGAHDEVGAWTDVYGLGVTLYTALTGQTPFATTSTAETLRRIESGDGTPLRKLNPRVPRDLATIVDKAMDRHPQRRYRTAAELACDLERFLHAEPILARRAGLGLRVARWTERNPWVAAAMLILGAGVAGTTWFALEARHLAAQALEQKGKAETSAALATERAEENAQLAHEKSELAATEAKAREEAQKSAVAAEERAKEIEQVLTFQESQWSEVDTESMGVHLRRAVIAQAKDAKRADLEADLVGVNFTSVALRMLQENLFERTLAAIGKGFGEQPLVKARLLQSVAGTLRELGLLDRMAAPQTEALEIRRRALGDDHPSTVASIINMGSLLKAQGKLADAEPFSREALETSRRVLGDDHQHTLTSLINMGSLLEAQGKLADAEPFLREALETSRRVLGDDHQHTLTSINNMGSLLYAQGKLTEAEPLTREALDKRRRALGDDHPDTLNSINNMGSLLRAQGKFLEAEPFYREALETRRRVLGDDHADTLTSISNMASLLVSQGKLTEAEPFLREALETGRRVLDDDHPIRLRMTNNLGQVLKEQHKLIEAEPLFRDALDDQRRVLGDDHPNTLLAINNMAGLLKAQGKLTEAEPLFREALEGSRRLLGDGHSTTLAVITNLGELLKAQGKLTEAEPLLREGLEKFRQVLGDDHPFTLTSINNMGSLLKAQGKLTEAEPLFREALEKCRLVLGDDHADTLSSIGNLGVLLEAQGKRTEAEPLFRAALEGYRRLLGDDHPSTLLSIYNLGFLLQAQGRLTEAEPLCREALEKRRRVLGDDHPDTLTSIRQLGVLLEALGKLSEAEPFFREALQKRRQLLTGDPHDTLASMNSLGLLLRKQGKLTEAEPLLREALDKGRRILGDDDVHTLRSIVGMGFLLVQTQRHREAVALLSAAEAAARRVFSGHQLARFFEALGRAHAGLEEPQELATAAAKLVEAYEIVAKSHGPTHQHTRGPTAALVDVYQAWHAAEPDKGYEQQAGQWKAKLRALGPEPGKRP